MISGSSYSRSVPQPDVITRPVTAARVLRLYSRALERAVTRRYSISIGSVVATVWSYEFPEAGNLLSQLLWLAIIARGIVSSRLGLNRR
jgi:hypothetical protein